MTGEQFGLLFLGLALLAVLAVLNNTVKMYRLHSEWAERKRLEDQAEYIKVLDVARRFNPDRKSIYSMQPPASGFQMAKFRAHEVSLNEDIDELHRAFRNLAVYFNEPDPCPCQRCYVSRATANMTAAEKLSLLRGAQVFR